MPPAIPRWPVTEFGAEPYKMDMGG